MWIFKFHCHVGFRGCISCTAFELSVVLPLVAKVLCFFHFFCCFYLQKKRGNGDEIHFEFDFLKFWATKKISVTLQTNIAPENWWLEDEFSFWVSAYLQVLHVSFREGPTGNTWNSPWPWMVRFGNEGFFMTPNLTENIDTLQVFGPPLFWEVTDGEFEHVLIVYIWMFPKIGVPQKWMVYNGKPY